jgi:hypothetical protein
MALLDAEVDFNVVKGSDILCCSTVVGYQQQFQVAEYHTFYHLSDKITSVYARIKAKYAQRKIANTRHAIFKFFKCPLAFHVRIQKWRFVSSPRTIKGKALTPFRFIIQNSWKPNTTCQRLYIHTYNPTNIQDSIHPRIKWENSNGRSETVLNRAALGEYYWLFA